MNHQLKIAANFKAIHSELVNAKLLAVTKFRTQEEIEVLYDLGQRHFGENKVQELCEKALALDTKNDIHWHFIGNLQSNKVNQLLKVPNLYAIHSVDSLKLAEKLVSKEDLLKGPCKIFLEVKTSGEDEKHGFESLNEIKEAMAVFSSCKKFQLIGLMTMGRIRTEDLENEARICFKKLQNFKEQLGKPISELSMGMSSDYKIAIEEGSNWVRIGSKLFE
ncbi:MAG: YggS family pyridoxal phosphate-dependent enzyme [Halobacteriovoraceae bacterium]|nr:YggS family pyridoxal phosphate-dependent enzyme [Halobacteriovoraceae bacterium]MCB9095176.1 YggS family pyridoxal phosphate-dependent enzyme [Halobacteriovoraceae bacterium]